MAFANPASGNNAPERKNIGMMTKFIINENACISSILDAIAVPKAAKSIAIKNIKTKASNARGILTGLNPIAMEIKKTTIPWNDATVAPPNVLPIIILYLATGATKLSLRNQNCLSQMTSIPLNMAVNKTLMMMIPGARNSI